MLSAIESLSSRRMLLRMLLFAIVVPAQMAFAAPPASDAVRQRVDVLLGGIEYVPTRKEWVALGREAGPALRAVATDRRSPAIRRGRAISVLSFFDSPATRRLLGQLAANARTPGILRRKAIESLARIAPEEALPVLNAMISHRDRRVREAAIKTLGSLSSRRAGTALHKRLKVEPRPHHRRLIREAIRAIDRRSKAGDAR